MKNKIEETTKKEIKRLRKQVRQYQGTLEYMGILPDFGELKGTLMASTISASAFRCNIAWNNDHINRARKVLVENGWEETYYSEYLAGESYSFRNWEYIKHTEDGERIKIDLYAFSTDDNATCEIVEIGKEKKTTEVAIYEVTCPEGAEEEVFA